MARNHDSHSTEGGVIKRAARSVMRLFGRGAGQSETAAGTAGTKREAGAKPAATSRPVKRTTDIPFDRLETYTPSSTSSKAGFRSDGTDHHTDQEFALGVAGDRWNDEDHYTNKSGDPRIGTRQRTYEPGETRAETRD